MTGALHCHPVACRWPRGGRACCAACWWISQGDSLCLPLVITAQGPFACSKTAFLTCVSCYHSGLSPQNFNFVPCLSVAKKITWNSPVSSLPPLEVYRPCSEISLLSARYQHSIQACFVSLHVTLLSFTGIASPTHTQIEGKTLH